MPRSPFSLTLTLTLTHVWQTNALSKITAAVLEDLEYIVDASAVRFDTGFAVGLYSGGP